MNRSLARFLNDLDRRDEERRKNLAHTLKPLQFDDEEKKMETEKPVQNQTQKEE